MLALPVRVGLTWNVFCTVFIFHESENELARFHWLDVLVADFGTFSPESIDKRPALLSGP